MSNPVQESYNPAALGVDGSFTRSEIGVSLGGLNVVTAGTLTITSGGTTFMNAMPISAGSFVPLPYTFGAGVTVQLGGGASGLLAWV